MSAPLGLAQNTEILSAPENAENLSEDLPKIVKEKSNWQTDFRRIFKAFSGLLCYIAYLTTLSIITFGSASDSQFHLTTAITKSLTGIAFGTRGLLFADVVSIPDVLAFFNEVAMPFLYPQQAYSNGTMKTSRFILGVNRLLGLPRLRQLRVRNDSCEIYPHFRAHITECFNEYDMSYEDKKSFGPANDTAWRYHTEHELGGSSYWATLTTYSGGGYYQDLGVSREEADRLMNILINNNWIDTATRIALLDFTVYNPSANLFSIVKAVFELPNTGGVWPSMSLRTVKLLRYVDSWDYIVLAFEILFCCFTLFYLIVEVREISNEKLQYFAHFWNWLDILISIISLIAIAFSLYRTIIINKQLRKILNDSEHHPSFDLLGFSQKQYDNIMSVLVFFCWIKIFRYLSFNLTMIQLQKTLSKSTKEVGGFAIMFFVVFFAYAQLGYLLFGAQIREFSRFRIAFFTVLRMTLGDFDFDNLERANRVLGPIYYITYVFLIYFILLNMFLAILNETYIEVKSDMDESAYETEYTRVFQLIYMKIRSWLHLDRKSEIGYPSMKKLPENIEDINHLNEYDKESHNFNDKEDAPLLDEKDKKDDNEPIVSLEEFIKLTYRVDDLTHELEQTQDAIIARIKLISEKMDAINTK